MFLIRVPSRVPAPWIRGSSQQSLLASPVQSLPTHRSVLWGRPFLGAGDTGTGLYFGGSTEKAASVTRGFPSFLLPPAHMSARTGSQRPQGQCVCVCVCVVLAHGIRDAGCSLLQEEDFSLEQQHREIQLKRPIPQQHLPAFIVICFHGQAAGPTGWDAQRCLLGHRQARAGAPGVHGGGGPRVAASLCTPVQRVP